METKFVIEAILCSHWTLNELCSATFDANAELQTWQRDGIEVWYVRDFVSAISNIPFKLGLCLGQSSEPRNGIMRRLGQWRKERRGFSCQDLQSVESDFILTL